MDTATIVQVASSILTAVFIVVVGLGYYYSTMAIRSQIVAPSRVARIDTAGPPLAVLCLALL
ncbi:MAG: hypothetical protein CYG60_15560 [Actinobacteria bacterium]|nr:MAG: hypothetical protein CYG60_15560 [Actinomycetota bacterium]